MRVVLWRSCLLLLLLQGFAYAQVIDSLTASYLQELDTRLWRVQENLNINHSDYSFQSSGYTSLTERRLSGYESQWKNDLSASVDISRQMTNHLNAVLEVSGQDFRDREAAFIANRNSFDFNPFHFDFPSTSTTRPAIGQNSHITRSSARAGIEYSPQSNIESSLLVGGAFDDQNEGSGSGISGSSNLYWGRMFDSDVDVEADGWLNQYSDRQNHHVFTRGLTLNQFGDAINQLAASWRNRRSDLFFGNEGQIVSRVSEEIRIDNRLVT